MDDFSKRFMEEMQAKASEFARFQRLFEMFPDLHIFEGRWKKYGPSSKMIKPDKYEWRFNCGCCTDSPAEVWLYTETPHGRVYTDPAIVLIGERDDSLGYRRIRPNAKWEDGLRKLGANENLLSKIAIELELYAPPERDEDEDEETE